MALSQHLDHRTKSDNDVPVTFATLVASLEQLPSEVESASDVFALDVGHAIFFLTDLGCLVVPPFRWRHGLIPTLYAINRHLLLPGSRCRAPPCFDAAVDWTR